MMRGKTRISFFDLRVVAVLVRFAAMASWLFSGAGCAEHHG